MSIILVGEHNPYGPDPQFALYPNPPNSSAGRLCRMLGLTTDEYLEIFEHRYNLITGHLTKWDKDVKKRATTRAREILEAHRGENTTYALLGRKVFDAFNEAIQEDSMGVLGVKLNLSWPWAPGGAVVADPKIWQMRYLILPHPSGRNSSMWPESFQRQVRDKLIAILAEQQMIADYCLPTGEVT